jgi:hypothetical protein|tara:strand:- start:474 stop:683 length:210 start_codon:yes stop_codon:yes gene_type:complete
MVIEEFKFSGREKTDQEKIIELKSTIEFLEDKYIEETAKEEPIAEIVTKLETDIISKREEYESLGGIYD